MRDGEAVPPQWERPRMRYAPQHNPLVLATLAMGAGGALLIVPHVTQETVGTVQMVVLAVAAIVAFVAGLLVLMRSAAIRRIGRLRDSNKACLDELARLNLYGEEVCAALRQAAAHRTGREADGMPLVRRLLDGATLRAGVAFDPAICIYLVESTSSRHVVLACSGRASFPVEAGKSCPADRTLQEVAATLGRFWEIVPLNVDGSRFHLVMLSERYPTRADCAFLEQLGLIISLADPRLRGQRGRPVLRAV